MNAAEQVNRQLQTLFDPERDIVRRKTRRRRPLVTQPSGQIARVKYGVRSTMMQRGYSLGADTSVWVVGYWIQAADDKSPYKMPSELWLTVENQGRALLMAAFIINETQHEGLVVEELSSVDMTSVRLTYDCQPGETNAFDDVLAFEPSTQGAAASLHGWLEWLAELPPHDYACPCCQQIQGNVS